MMPVAAIPANKTIFASAASIWIAGIIEMADATSPATDRQTVIRSVVACRGIKSPHVAE